MSQEPENLLESDGLDAVLEMSGPPTELEVPEGSAPTPAEVPEGSGPLAPVVVVQYGNRSRSWLLFVALAAALTLGGLLAHNWREARRLRIQTIQAQRDYQRAMEKARADEAELKWMAAERASVAMSPTPPAPTPVQPVPAPAATATATRESPGPPRAEKPQDPPPAPAAGRPESTRPQPPKVLAKLPEKVEPTPSSKARSDVPVEPPSAPPRDTKTPIETAAILPDSRDPFEDLEGVGDNRRAPTRSDVAAAPASATKSGDPPVAAGAPAARPAEPPLPSREEIERQINEEATKMREEQDRREVQQQEDLKALSDEDRRQFLDELEMVLKAHGKRAGPEIEQLAQRAGRKEDPKLLARARWVITESRASQRIKVRQLRAIGVPETVILDYLANTLNRKLGARDGPRTRDEVWVQAAGLLLRYSRETLRPAGAAAPEGRPSDQAGGAQQPAGRTDRPK
jgi:hypothetical protein